MEYKIKVMAMESSRLSHPSLQTFNGCDMRSRLWSVIVPPWYVASASECRAIIAAIVI
jgi:hypothetical protein